MVVVVVVVMLLVLNQPYADPSLRDKVHCRRNSLREGLKRWRRNTIKCYKIGNVLDNTFSSNFASNAIFLINKFDFNKTNSDYLQPNSGQYRTLLLLIQLA